MRKYLLIFAILLILTLLQLSFFPALLGVKFAPNLVLAFCFALLLAGDFDLATFGGLVGGVLIDLLSFSVFGVSAVVFCATLVGAYAVRKYVFRGFFIFSLLSYFAYVVYTVALSAPNFYFRPEAFISAIGSFACFGLFLAILKSYIKPSLYKV